LPQPDSAERLAAADLEADVVDRLDVADVAVEDDPALDRKPDLQVLDLDKIAVHAHGRLLSRSTPASAPDDAVGRMRRSRHLAVLSNALSCAPLAGLPCQRRPMNVKALMA
jgi:hypothetical protein